jgi:hypothetical protein
MTATGLPPATETSLGRDLLHAARYHLRGWRTPVAVAAILLVAGVAFGWGWLVAAGVAPLLLSVLPCAVMCALGLCMSRMTGRQCSTDAASRRAAEQARPGEPGDVQPQQRYR